MNHLPFINFPVYNNLARLFHEGNGFSGKIQQNNLRKHCYFARNVIFLFKLLILWNYLKITTTFMKHPG